MLGNLSLRVSVVTICLIDGLNAAVIGKEITQTGTIHQTLPFGDLKQSLICYRKAGDEGIAAQVDLSLQLFPRRCATSLRHELAIGLRNTRGQVFILGVV